MPMSAICAVGGRAPIAPHHGHVNFNFDQTAHGAFLLLGAGGGGGAPPGCCLALTMAWLQNWRNPGQQGYTFWVGPGGGGNGGVLANTVGVFAGGAGAWAPTTTALMGGMGFVALPGGLQNGPPWAGIMQTLPPSLAAARFIILIYTYLGVSHAVGIFRTGVTICFFDPNEGEAYFPTTADFAAWFFDYMRTTPGTGLATARNFFRLLYN